VVLEKIIICSEYFWDTMGTIKRKRRVCDYCGLLTNEEYTNDEWDAVGHECQDYIDAEW
jgi:hypothetical protein